MSETNAAGGRRLQVWAIPESRDGEKTFWVKIGVAFTNRDGGVKSPGMPSRPLPWPNWRIVRPSNCSEAAFVADRLT